MLDYLNDTDFLQELDNFNMKVSYVKITLLDFNEEVLKEIQGTISAGSLNVNGSAAVRRTINLTMLVPFDSFNITDLNNDIALNKKIKVEVGYKNPLFNYIEKYGETIWFPCGIFIISQASITKNTSGWMVQLSGKDKMVQLDGTVGGVLPASVSFHEIYVYDEEENATIEHPTIFQIIQEAVHHFGREEANNIIISDIPDTAKLLIKYIGDNPIYFAPDYNSFSYVKDENNYPYGYSQGQDIGYQETPFTYPGELILNAGDTVVSLLTKIVNILGNFEFFYDLDGHFVFQQKKNYLNIASPLLSDIKLDDYIGTYSNTEHKYSLTNAKTTTSIGQTPKYDNIKNDYIVWGKSGSGKDSEVALRYHLAIDTKPEDILSGENCSLCHMYITEVFFKKDKQISRHLVTKDYPVEDNINTDIEEFKLDEEGNIIIIAKPLESYTPQLEFEWREELYRIAVLNSSTGVSYGPYDAELLAEWRKLYNPDNSEWEQGWNPAINEDPGSLTYWLDFIDTNSEIGKYSVNAIGRRSIVLNDSNIGSVYNNTVPDIIFLSREDANFNDLVKHYDRIGQTYIPLTESTFQQFRASSTKASAFDRIRDLLSQHLTYNTQITISCLPKYYMQPNNIIYIEDESTGIIGNYEISQFSLPLGYSGTMTITANEILSRI